jgi:hypothetical protein
MAERTFKLIRVSYPLTAMCEACQKVFTSRAEKPEDAEREIKASFKAHKCVRANP